MHQKYKEPNYISQLVGDCFRLYRKEKGWSGKKMAEYIGISQQQLSRYERGVNAITVDMLVNILIILDIKLSEFYARLISHLFSHPELSNHLPYLTTTDHQIDDIKQYYTSSLII
ncbi:helix-turn-helix domain-containing protein [Providencia vermicola]|uniref:helix-turn-helix domain-containing protein n=1 Tax=Providencia vermicola TaxID=333965 RepID=UPI002AB53E8C|nr:helix-turn-helix transcriptional regulator [Providencia stuartii]